MNIASTPPQAIMPPKPSPDTPQSPEAVGQSFPDLLATYKKPADTNDTEGAAEPDKSKQIPNRDQEIDENILVFISIASGVVDSRNFKNSDPVDFDVSLNTERFPRPANAIVQSMQKPNDAGSPVLALQEASHEITENISASEVKKVLNVAASDTMLEADFDNDALASFSQIVGGKNTAEFSPLSPPATYMRGVINLDDPATWAKNLGAEIVALKPDQGALHLRINPRHLGGLSVAILSTETGDLLMIRADTAAAQGLIQSAQGQLEMELRMSGNRFARIEITTQEATDFSAADYAAGDGSNPHARSPASQQNLGSREDTVTEPKIEQSSKSKSGLFA